MLQKQIVAPSSHHQHVVSHLCVFTLCFYSAPPPPPLLPAFPTPSHSTPLCLGRSLKSSKEHPSHTHSHSLFWWRFLLSAVCTPLDYTYHAVFSLCLCMSLSFEGCQKMPPQNTLPWHKDFFELKKIKKKKRLKNNRCKKGTLTYPFLPESRR